MRNLIYKDGFEDRRASIGTAKLLFGAAAGASFLLSIYLFFSGAREQGIFVGIWVPSILSAGNLVLAARE